MLLEGMFAFAILDVKRERLLLARDPFGIKPLFYSLDGERLVFGSEIKPLLESGEVSRAIDPAALNDYFDFHWIPAPRSIFADVRKLLPAHTMELDLRNWQSAISSLLEAGIPAATDRTLEDWADEVQAELNRSVKAQMVADVPVGTFLSGGIDSTLVSRGGALATDEPLRTFTIDFANEQFSEQAFAAQVATAIHARPTVRRVEPEAIDHLPQTCGVLRRAVCRQFHVSDIRCQPCHTRIRNRRALGRRRRRAVQRILALSAWPSDQPPRCGAGLALAAAVWVGDQAIAGEDSAASVGKAIGPVARSSTAVIRLVARAFVSQRGVGT